MRMIVRVGREALGHGHRQVRDAGLSTMRDICIGLAYAAPLPR